VCQVATHLIKLAYFGGIVGPNLAEIGWPVMALSVLLALTGTSLSRTILERLSDVQFRLWTQRIVLAIGGACLIQGLMLYSQA
jgi:uncharacterized protein